MNWSHNITSQIVVGRYRVGKNLGRWIFGFNGIHKGYFKEIIVLESEAKYGIYVCVFPGLRAV